LSEILGSGGTANLGVTEGSDPADPSADQFFVGVRSAGHGLTHQVSVGIHDDPSAAQPAPLPFMTAAEGIPIAVAKKIRPFVNQWCAGS
jgi:hypothetical protein